MWMFFLGFAVCVEIVMLIVTAYHLRGESHLWFILGAVFWPVTWAWIGAILWLLKKYPGGSLAVFP